MPPRGLRHLGGRQVSAVRQRPPAIGVPPLRCTLPNPEYRHVVIELKISDCSRSGRRWLRRVVQIEDTVVVAFAGGK